MTALDKPTFVFTGTIINEKNGYSSLCIDLDVASQGDTKEEAKKNLMEAVTLYLETAIDNNLPLIRPVLKNDNPINTRPDDIVEIFKMNISFQVQAYAWIAYCPDLPGCIATGSTSEETIKKMKEAIKFHLEGLKKENLPIPESSTRAVSIEIAVNQ